MKNNLVKKLRGWPAIGEAYEMLEDAADQIEELEARLKRTEDRLKEYDHGMAQIRRWIETGEIPR